MISNIRTFISNKMLSYFIQHESRMQDKIDFTSRAVLLQDKCLHSDISGITNDKLNGHSLTISLTTYGKRLYDVYLTIESLMQQTVKANRIILWLEEELRNNRIPTTLERQIKRGLEIRYCKNIRSYKKLIYTLQSYPNDIIITVDDDAIYNFDMVENLVNSYLEQPNMIHANLIRRIALTEDGYLKNYSEWPYINDCKVDILNVPIGVGGVLYPPHSLSSEVFNIDFFSEKCAYADDIWFKAMAVLNNVSSKRAKVHEPIYFSNESVQDISLANINLFSGQNDSQIKSIFSKYDIYNRLQINH